MQRQESFFFVAFVFLVLPFHVHCGHFKDRDYKVLISNSGTTKLGEVTTFDAKVGLKSEERTKYTAENENIFYEFFWKVPSEPWIKHNKTTHGWNSFQWRWKNSGEQTVSVYVRILVGNSRGSEDDRRYRDGYVAYYARNHTGVTVIGDNDNNKIIATLNAYQDSSEYKTGNIMYGETFYAGKVHLEVKINKPQDLHTIKCDWNFGDGSPQLHNSDLNLSHTFATVAPSAVNVTIHGASHGRQYIGYASKTLKFKANITVSLIIKNSTGPKLPSRHKHAFATNSPVTFEVKFEDPFKVITGVSGIDWKFGDGGLVSDCKNTTMLHTYQNEGTYSLWVTIRVHTKYQKKMSLDPINRNLYVKAPVSLEVQHKHAVKDKIVTFNISCNGSLPVSFHWCVFKQCNLPSGQICSPMMEHKNSCSLVVKHTFRDSGEYCVNVGVMNDVSGTNTSLMVQIPGDVPGPKHKTGKKTADVLVPIFIGFFLLVLIIFLVRKWTYSKREKTEKADFDFRDDDTSSLSSVDLYGTRSCFPRCGILGSCTKQEYVPLRLQAAENRMYTL